jgi:hypothetical protein
VRSEVAPGTDKGAATRYASSLVAAISLQEGVSGDAEDAPDRRPAVVTVAERGLTLEDRVC